MSNFLFLYLISAFSLKQGHVINYWPFIDYQKNFYNSGFRNIWQVNSNCVKLDAALIYSPKIGNCFFNNVEFDTALTFSEYGRVNPDGNFDKNLPGIAILGDSHAMGWGVNDEDTFSNKLQIQSKRPVYNLGVSSYGTYRELKRLKLSGLLDKVDTIIIQYCSNDKKENIELLTNPDFSNRTKSFSSLIGKPNVDFLFLSNLSSYIKFSLSQPINKILSYFPKKHNGRDFSSHLDPFKNVLKYFYNDVKDKKIIVFYSNRQGGKFYNFPSGADTEYENLYFYDLDLNKSLYFDVDDHLKAVGHQEVANKLMPLLSLDKRN